MKNICCWLTNYLPAFYLLFFSMLSQQGLGQKQKDAISYLFKTDGYFMEVIEENDSTYICRYYNKFGPITRQEAYFDSALSIPNGDFAGMMPGEF